MAKRNPPSPVAPTHTGKRGLAEEEARKGTSSNRPEREDHELTHEDGDAETHGAPQPVTDDADKAQPHEARQAAARDEQTARAVQQSEPEWLGASSPKRAASQGTEKRSTSGSGGHGYAPQIAHGEESGYGPADAVPGEHPRFGRQSAYGPHDDYAGTGRDASGSMPPVRSPAQSRQVDWPKGTVGVEPVDALKRNAKASSVEDIEGEAGQAAGRRGRSGGRGNENEDVKADGAIHDAIRKSLSDAIDLDVSHVEVSVTSGLVLLTGYVPERWMQHVVQTEVEKVDGVKGVDNRLHERRMKSMSRPGESQEGHKI
ncbi:BON domain-containing protein [Pandoraea oxalativorans]|uniref:BON domain-containing protein n=1 Tax=Pandoraea oxalativorans TaxID=573737 RepID=A0A0E3YBY4_9BURK|nr:BON domain-containing protein [Pandoraea oxalativorans]AKC70692.1 hypothetical protein MB84_16150 [Pandoraea oxalativorans]